MYEKPLKTYVLFQCIENLSILVEHIDPLMSRDVDCKWKQANNSLEDNEKVRCPFYQYLTLACSIKSSASNKSNGDADLKPFCFMSQLKATGTKRKKR